MVSITLLLFTTPMEAVLFTPMRSDAGTYVTIEKAAQVCRALQQNSYSDLLVVPVEEA